jgi:hypothetical protein
VIGTLSELARIEVFGDITSVLSLRLLNFIISSHTITVQQYFGMLKMTYFFKTLYQLAARVNTCHRDNR